MKIFRFFSNNITDDSAFYNQMSTVTIPDTALLIQKRPFFIPDFTSQCMLQLCICVRINRLGRSIHEHFAQRYYKESELAIGTHFVARDLLSEMMENNLPWDKAVGFDNAIVVAENACGIVEDTNVTYLTLGDDTHEAAFSLSELLPVINHQIALISQYYTLRQGDILMLPLRLEELQVSIDQHVSLSVNGKDVLQFNIK